MISEEVNTLINTYEKMCEKYTFDSLFRIRQDEMKLILGLIANLQQENQSLKSRIKTIKKISNDWENISIDLQQENQLLKEQLKYEEDWRIKCAKERDEAIKDGLKIVQENQSLKDRIEKAIEWINAHIDIFEERNITIYDWNTLSDPKQLLEILKGGKECQVRNVKNN